jgi:hypothetical protein
MTDTDTDTGFVVLDTIEGALEHRLDYDLFEGDLLVRQDDYSFVKISPGLVVSGFVLSPEDYTKLQRVEFVLTVEAEPVQ